MRGEMSKKTCNSSKKKNRRKENRQHISWSAECVTDCTVRRVNADIVHCEVSLFENSLYSLHLFLLFR